MALATLHETDSDVDPEQLLAEERRGASGAASPFRRRAALAGALVLSLAAALVALHAHGVSLESTSLLFQQKFGHAFGHGHRAPHHGDALLLVKFFEARESHAQQERLLQETAQGQMERLEALVRGAEVVEEHRYLSQRRLLGAEDHDKDNNRQLEGDELTAFKADLEEKLSITDADFHEAMEAADQNGDGKLAKAEMFMLGAAVHKELQDLPRLMEEHFGLASKDFQDALSAADMNKDGKLEDEEAAAFLADVHTNLLHHHPHDGHHPHFDHYQHGGHRRPGFALDGNGKVHGNELIELKEALAKTSTLAEADVEAAIKASDVNKDGVLGQPEMSLLFGHLHSKVVGKSFHKYDADGNGKVGGKELQWLKSNMTHHFKVSDYDFHKMFQVADGNHDGKLEENEAPLFLLKLNEVVIFGPHNYGGRLDKDMNGLVEGKELEEAKASLQAMNKVTDAEYERIFAEADHNGDGKLARVELRKFIYELREESIEALKADRTIRSLVHHMLM